MTLVGTVSLVGTTVGRIRILDVLGQGGMGEVYVGYDDTLKRKVALKAIRNERRLDSDTKARFLREARILSQLDHPGICRIYDLIEEDGRDFLVLELIDGRNLRDLLTEEEIGPALALHIAERVAEALVAAHAIGVAHRDLKPDNVMLTDDGGVKVLDFGLAYTVDEQLARTLGDGGGAEIEDGADADQIDTRADRDSPSPERPSTGTVPLSKPPWGNASEGDTSGPDTDPGLGPGGMFETQPGTVMGTVAYMSPEQARGERATPAGDMYSFGLLLQELFTGKPAYEPQLPLMKLLHNVSAAKTLPVTGIDPDLADLVNRLESFAPETRPSAVEATERLRWIRGKPGRRLLRRIAAVLLAVLLLGGLKYTFDLRRERAAAEAAQREAEQVSEFLVNLFEVSDPRRARGTTITALELLDEGAKRISGDPLRPRTRSRLMLTMGRVYRNLGLYDRALPLAQEALEIRRGLFGDDHLDTAMCLDLLASLYTDRGEYEGAEPLFQRALEIRQQALGRDHPHVAASLNNLAFLYRAQDRTEPAEPLLLRALAIHEENFGGEHPDVARSLNNLGDLYRGMGEPGRAEPFLRRAVEVQEKLLGSDHPNLATSLNNLAMIHHLQGETELAELLFRRALEIQEKVLGAAHPDVAVGLNNLAELYRVTGEGTRAEPLYLRALEIQEAALGTAHPSVAITLSNLADLYSAGAEAQRAKPLYERALAIQEEALGRDHPSVAVTLNHRADLYQVEGEPERAEPLYQRALAIQEKAFGRDHPSVAITLADLAGLYARLGRVQEAQVLYLRAQASTKQVLAKQPDSRSGNHRLAAIRVGLGKLYRATGAAERAVESWTRATDLMEPLTAGSDRVAFLHTHAVALLYLGRVEEARPMAAELLAKGWSDPDFLELCREHGLPAIAPLRRPAAR